MFKRFISYYKPYKLTFYLDLLASFVMSCISVAYPIVTRNMLNDFIPNKKVQQIIICGFTLLLLYFIKMVLTYCVAYFGHIMGTKMQADMRKQLFVHLQKLPFEYYDDNQTGKIMTRLTEDIAEITELAHHGPENLIITSITIVLSFIYLLTINVKLALILFICVPVLFVVSNGTRKRHLTMKRQVRKVISAINASMNTSISGIRVTKAFNNAVKEEEKFDGFNKQYIEAQSKQYNTMAQYHSSTTFVTDIFNVVILIAGGLFMYDSKVSFADYSAFVVAISSFINPVRRLIDFVEQLQSGITGFENFCAILDETPELDKENAIELNNVKGKICFKNVNYGYEKDHEILKDVSFEIQPGKRIALVGSSGGGKTTICHLLPRFYDYKDGKITIDDIDINDVTRSSLRANIGIVQQDMYLFDGTIKENILYGKLDATYEEMVEAAKAADIDEFVKTLPNGYDTLVGENGVKLSGGQKQRICIARIFLKNPAILILDEATSALDNITEAIIQEALDKLCENRTTIVVAHRLSTVRNADEILVIEEGKISERGNHQQLLDSKGVYYNLYQQSIKI